MPWHRWVGRRFRVSCMIRDALTPVPPGGPSPIFYPARTSQEGVGYLEITRTLFHEDRGSNRGRSRRARLSLGVRGRSKIDPMNGHDCALPRFREGRFLFFGDGGGLWFQI